MFGVFGGKRALWERVVELDREYRHAEDRMARVLWIDATVAEALPERVDGLVVVPVKGEGFVSVGRED